MGELEQLWARIYLPESQKNEVLKALELFENDVPGSPRGLLLTGPSGVGKSLLGKTIAETVGCSFQHLTPAALKMDHLGGSGQRVREVWAKARREQPSILYLDECEGVLGRRGSAETDAISTEIVQAFLAEWDGLSKDNRVLVIGATNRRDLLDDAILSRFGWEMKISLPSEEDRIQILDQELTSVGIEVTLPAEFGPLTQGMSGRDLQEVARTARRMAHPELPSLEQIREAIARLRKGRNTVVSTDSKWENLVLDAKLLSRLKLVSSLLRDTEKWRAQGISIPRSLLLQGPSGTGKTEIGRTLANESGLAFFAATTADLKANYLGQSGNRVKQVFERARAHAPSILFLDELDIVAPDRGVGEDDPLTREIVGQLLQEIDGVQAHPEHVFLLGATNRPEIVDGAVLSRFAERLQVPLPDHAARIQLLAILLKGKKFDFSLEDGVRLLADLTEGRAFSGRDLRSWVASAEQNALMRALESGGPDTYVITLDDFSSAI
jgi:SpoVK/Ycf46/Vps4 family AAA+-type ATPase